MRIRNRDPGWRQFGSGIRDGKKSDPQHWLPQNARIRRNTEHKTLWFPKRTYFHANLVHIRYRSIIVIYVSPLLFVIFRLLFEIIFNSNCTFLFYLLRKALSNRAVLFLLFAAGIIVKLNQTLLLYLPRDSLSNQALLFFLFVVLCRGNHCQIVPYGTFILYSLQNFLSNCTVHFCFEIIFKLYRTFFSFLPWECLSNCAVLFCFIFVTGIIVSE